MVLDVKTRWNSLFYMLERFLCLFKTISIILLDKTSAPPVINATELSQLKEILILLQPLENLTKKISGDTYVTISTILPLVNCVRNATENIVVISLVGKELKMNLCQEIHRRFENLEVFNDFPISTLLDPR